MNLAKSHKIARNMVSNNVCRVVECISLANILGVTINQFLSGLLSKLLQNFCLGPSKVYVIINQNIVDFNG